MTSLRKIALTARRFAPRVEVLGLFGAGKTTLARALSGGSLGGLFEQHEQIPYWGDTALGQIGYLAYDLAFLLHHHHLAFKAQSESAHICDWSFMTDLLWARLRLNATELGAYERVHRLLTSQASPPAVYLYLRLPPRVVIDQIRSRARAGEKFSGEEIESGFDLLDREVKQVRGVQVIEVTRESDLAKLSATVRELVARSD